MPIIIPTSQLSRPKDFPVETYSYSLFSQFSSNPVLFRIKYLNRDVIETTKSSNAVLGSAIHFGLRAFLGGAEEWPVPNDDSGALKVALEATASYIEGYHDGYIDWKGNVPTREKLQELAFTSLPQYIREWDRGDIKEVLMIDQKMTEAVRVRIGDHEIELPIPLTGYPDLVYENTLGQTVIVDHKTTFQYSAPDAIDGGKLIQAAMYYLMVYASTGKAPYKIVFREYKVSENKDKSAHTREYTMIYEEMPMIFSLFFRFYQDVTDAILGKQVYVPNIFAMFDRDIALMAYIYRLDEPDVLEKEKKRNKVEDVALLLQKKMARSRNLKRFMEAKSNLFTSHISLDYKTMQSHEKIKMKLMEHGLLLNFSDKVEGLSVDLYRFEPSIGIKMSTLEKYQKDIEQVLAITGVRILAPIPGTDLIGFEVPKANRKFVSLSEAKKAPSFEIPFGVNVYGERRDVDIREAPHILGAGTTGSGKSVWLHATLSHLSRLPQHEVRFALIDPKLVELSHFQDDPHTDYYADEPQEIVTVLLHYVEKMNERYAIFKKHKVRSLKEYREKVAKDLPYVILVIDEFGDLIMQGGDLAKEVKRTMVLLAQKARASGIHLIITTQSPRAKIVDGTIKANFPTRIAFRTVSRLESEIVIDRPGAELLLGKGDMLLVGAGGSAERLQGYNV